MMKVQIPYGHEMLELEVPESQVVGVRSPKPMPPASDPDTLLRQSIEVGIQERGLAAKAGPGAKACIIITDRTRSTPNRLVVPIVLDQLNAIGVPDENIVVISGGGMHAPDSEEDLSRTVGQAVLNRCERSGVVTNEPDNDAVMVNLGTTDIGTPVEVHHRFAEADIKIGITNVNPLIDDIVYTL